MGKIVTLAVVALLGVLPTSSTAVATSGWPRDVSLEPSKTTLTAGHASRLTGIVSSENPNTPQACLAGIDVTLSRQNIATRDWEDVHTTLTDDDGRFSIVVAPEETSPYVARVDVDGGTDPNTGEPICSSASSAPISIAVRVRVRLEPAVQAVGKRSTARLRAAVLPCPRSHRGTNVFLYHVAAGRLEKIGDKQTNRECVAVFERRIFDDRVFRARWPKQDIPHQSGRSALAVVQLR